MARIISYREGSTALRWSFLASVIFAVVGFLAALALTATPIFIVFYGGTGLPKREFPLLVALASGIVGGTCWWLLVERSGRLTRERGGLVGMLTGLLVHPVTWVLVLTVQDIRAGRLPLQGSQLVASLFLFWGLGLVGTFTVTIGVVGGLLVTIARERLSDEVVTGRNLILVGAIAVLSGWMAVVFVLATGGFFPVVVGGGLLAASVTLLALRRLPVVRTFLGRCYLLNDGSTSVRLGSSFRRRHATVLVISGIGFLIGALGYAALVSFLCHSVLTAITEVSTGSIYYCLWDNRLTFYPVFFVIGSVPVVLVVNRFVNQWAPMRSLRRAAIEWIVFLALVSGSYTAAFVVLFPL